MNVNFMRYNSYKQIAFLLIFFRFFFFATRPILFCFRRECRVCWVGVSAYDVAVGRDDGRGNFSEFDELRRSRCGSLTNQFPSEMFEARRKIHLLFNRRNASEQTIIDTNILTPARRLTKPPHRPISKKHISICWERYTTMDRKKIWKFVCNA